MIAESNPDAGARAAEASSAQVQAQPAIAHRLEMNLVLLAAGESAAKVCTFLAFSHLARTLGPERYGALEFVLAIVMFLSLVVDFGLGNYGAREIAKNRGGARTVLAEITGLRILLACGAFAVLILLAFVLNRGVQVTQLFVAYAFSLFGGPFLLQWFFQAHDRMGMVALASSLRQLVFALAVLFFFRPGTPLVWIGIAECFSVAATGAVCLALIRWHLRESLVWPSLHWNRAVRPHWQQVAPMGFGELAWASMWYFATVLLGFLFADRSLGWFGASHRVLMALHTFVWMYFFNLLPSISRCAAQPNQTLIELMQRSMRFTAWTGLYGAFLLTVLSSRLMALAFGESFRGAGSSLAVLAWMLPVALLSGHYRYILIAYNQQSRLLWTLVVSAAVAFAAGGLLVPKMGAIGAGWALLIANCVNCALVFREVDRSVVRIPFLREFAMPCAGLAAASVLYLVTRNEWLAVGAATVGYVIVAIRNHGPTAVRVWNSVRKTDALSGESAAA